MSSSTLIIDSELERLIPQLSHDELELLEKSILEEGCLEPLYVWNGTILDGHHPSNGAQEYFGRNQTLFDRKAL